MLAKSMLAISMSLLIVRSWPVDIRMVGKILGAISSREDAKTRTIVAKFLAERASRFVRTEKQGGIIRARSRYSAVSFLHGQCYSLLFHGRYQSYIFIVGVPHLSLASSLLSLLLAHARLFPMRVGRTFSNYLPCLDSLAPPTSRRFDFRRTVFARGICVGGYYVLDMSEPAWSLAPRERSRTFLLSVSKKERRVLYYVHVFSDDCSKPS